jgi:Ca2+-transporting ATPase
LCRLDEARRAQVGAQVEQMAVEGLRVLGVAEARAPDEASLPEEQRGFEFTFIGLIRLADPIRPTVPDAVTESYRAGIRVVMLTGDYPVTAQNIARQVGLHPLDPVITGADIDRLDDATLEEQIRVGSIFARVRPEQ